MFMNFIMGVDLYSPSTEWFNYLEITIYQLGLYLAAKNGKMLCVGA